MGERSKKTRRWRAFCRVALGSAGLGLVFVILVRSDNVQFAVDGVPFPVWVAQRPDFQIEDHLAALGTNAIPRLVQILHRPGESTKAYQAKLWLWNHLPQKVQSKFSRFRPLSEWQLKRTALFGLRFFGPEAESALPEIIRYGRAETNRMVRAGALVAALNIAPHSPDTFRFWRDEWEHTNYFTRHDLAIYVGSVRCAIPEAVPYLINEAEHNPVPITYLEAMAYFGETARPAGTQIVRSLEDHSFRGNALGLVRQLGPVIPEATPWLVHSLADGDIHVIAAALEAVSAIGPGAQAAAPAIEPLVHHSDPTIQMLAAAALARIKDKPEMAIPVLIAGLEGKLPGHSQAYVHVPINAEMAGAVTHGPPAAAMLLGELGPPGRGAMPALEKQLDSENPSLRLAAAQAVWRIGRDPQKALPVLMRILETHTPTPSRQNSGDNYVVVGAVQAIGEMGTSAKQAVPALERLRSSSMLIRRSVNVALRQISPNP